MTEDVAVFLISKRIATIFVFLKDKTQECLRIFFMDKSSVIIDPKKLSEVESHIFIYELME